ncbi:MAG TPA: DUF3667 domain-containing protein [Bacteroidia bacterium]|nr:DUF3667 domain-containing protein [Bacteroidia bacterium]
MAAKIRMRSPFCTNCGKELHESDNFCPHCGQENDNKRQSFGRIMSELVIGFLSIESRLAHSIPALLFRPAFLTKEYLNGRRQRYLDPVRMFLTIVVIFFLVGSLEDDTNVDQGKKQTTESSATISENLKDTLLILDEGPLQLNFTEHASEDSNAISDSTDHEDLELDDANYGKIKELIKEGVTDENQIMDSLKIKNTFWNRFYYHEVIKFANTDFEDLKAYFISKLPWVFFSLIPLFAFILKMLYFRRKFLYIDHLIFAFHLHSFYFLTAILNNIISWISGFDCSVIANLFAIVYSFMALKNFYQQGYLKTALKFLTLYCTYFISALVSLIFIAFVIFLFY